MRLLNKIIGIVTFVLLFLNLVFYVKSLQLSVSIKSIEKEIGKLELDVEKLEEKALASESVSNIASIAAELGYSEIKNIVNIEKVKVAFKE